MTRKDLLTLNKALTGMGDLTGVKFAYFVNRNLKLLQPELEAVKEASKPAAEYIEYERRRLSLCQECALKDDKGEPVVRDDEFIIDTAKQNKFKEEVAKLTEQYKEALNARQKQLDELEELLNEQVDIKLLKIKLIDIPANISVKQMAAIQDLIEE